MTDYSDNLWLLSMTEDLNSLTKDELVKLVIYLRDINLNIYDELNRISFGEVDNA